MDVITWVLPPPRAIHNHEILIIQLLLRGAVSKLSQLQSSKPKNTEA